MTELEDIRAFYLKHINNLYHKKTNNSVLMNRQEYQAKLERLLVLEDPLVSKTASDYKILKMCDLLITDVDGTQTPKLCRRGTNLLFVPIEELFDIIHKAHLHLRHAGRNCLQRYFRDKYCNVTKDCIMSYLITCKNCPRKKRIQTRLNGQKTCNKSDVDEEDECDDRNDEFFHSVAGNSLQTSVVRDSSTDLVGVIGANARVVATTPLHMPLFKSHLKEQHQDESFSRGQVDVFNMQKEPDGEFNWILRYINLTTNEVRLRPLRSGTAHETADLLVDIYCEQGAPVVLQSLNGRNFAEEVIREVVKIWPQCRQLHSYVKKTNSAEYSENLLINQLSNLMKRHETNSWAGMLRYLQWEFNTAYNNDTVRAPIENSLGKIPTLGLKSSKLLDAIYDKARSEEEIMEYLQDAELLRLSAFCSTSCPTPEPSTSPNHNKRSRLAAPLSQYINNQPGHSLNNLSSGAGIDYSQMSGMGSSNAATGSPSMCTTPTTIGVAPLHYEMSLSSKESHSKEIENKLLASQSHRLSMSSKSQDVNNLQLSFMDYSIPVTTSVGLGVSLATQLMSSHLPQSSVNYIHNSQGIYHEANSMMNHVDEQQQQQSNNPLELSIPGPTNNFVKAEISLAQTSPACATGVNPNGLLAMEVNHCIVDRNMNC